MWIPSYRLNTAQLFIEKNPHNKLTHGVQTCIVQGSTVQVQGTTVGSVAITKMES